MGYPSMNESYIQTKYNVTKCSSNRRANGLVKYIVVHYTGTSASALNNVKYFSGGNRNASADYFIDKDGTIYKFNGDCSSYYTWHCGDGKGKYGVSNSNSIGIEVVSAGEEYTQAQKESLRALVTAIMDDYGVSASNVVRHYDASRKSCPAAYCGSASKDAKWKELKAYITTAQKEEKITVSTWIYESNGSDAQKWVLEPEGDHVRIKAKCNGMYLDVAEGETAHNTPVRVCIGNGTKAQLWRMDYQTHANDKWAYIRSALDEDMVLATYGGGKTQGTGTVIGAFDGASAQKWALVWAGEDSTYFLCNLVSGLMLDVYNGGN